MSSRRFVRGVRWTWVVGLAACVVACGASTGLDLPGGDAGSGSSSGASSSSSSGGSSSGTGSGGSSSTGSGGSSSSTSSGGSSSSTGSGGSSSSSGGPFCEPDGQFCGAPSACCSGQCVQGACCGQMQPCTVMVCVALGPKACEACTANSCCAQLSACEADPACNKSIQCVAMCEANGNTGASCSAPCGLRQTPLGAALYNCGAQQCSQECTSS